jgi:hypothetical protein
MNNMMDYLKLSLLEVDFFEIIWGTIFTLILSMILGYFFGSIGSYTGFLLISAIVGYKVNEDMINGVIYGSLVAVLGGMLSFITMLIMWYFGVGPGSTIMMFGIVGVILGLIIDLIVGAVGGAIGSTLKR